MFGLNNSPFGGSHTVDIDGYIVGFGIGYLLTKIGLVPPICKYEKNLLFGTPKQLICRFEGG